MKIKNRSPIAFRQLVQKLINDLQFIAYPSTHNCTKPHVARSLSSCHTEQDEYF